jgi:hypothetical protein
MKLITMCNPDAAWLDLRESHRFQAFFLGLLEYLKSNLPLVEVIPLLSPSYFPTSISYLQVS